MAKKKRSYKRYTPTKSGIGKLVTLMAAGAAAEFTAALPYKWNSLAAGGVNFGAGYLLKVPWLKDQGAYNIGRGIGRIFEVKNLGEEFFE